MSDLQQQIQAAIERDLPKQVGDALQQRLTQADQLERQLNSALAREQLGAETLKLRDATIQALTGDLTKLRAELAVFQQREAAFAAAERELLVATLKLERADAVTNAVKEVVAQFTKNPELRRTHTVSEFQGGQTVFNNGKQEFVPNGSRTTTETDVETRE